MRFFAPAAAAARRLPLLFVTALATAAAAPLLAAPAAVAQAADAATPEPPFVGEVSVPRVEVRSGAGEFYYPVAELVEGDRVRVVESFYSWYRIEVPEGLHAFVSAKDVDRRGDGSVGVVNAEATRVRIKGRDLGWDESFRTIKTLDPGDRVQIVAPAGGEAYEILAPEGSLVFLPPNSVRPLAGLADGTVPRPADPPRPPAPPAAGADATGDTDPSRGEMVPLAEALAAETAQPPPPAPMSTLAIEPTPAPEPAPAEQPATARPDTLPPLALGNNPAATPEEPAPDALSLSPITPPGLASEGLAAVEEAQLPRFALPLEEQPLDEMEAAYAELLGGDALAGPERQLVESRLRAIQRNRQLTAAVAQIQQRKDGLVPVEPTAIEPEPEEPFAAVGILRTSTVFAGEEAGVALPKMFRVIDPATERTIAYLRPARGVDPVALLGQLVGVRGAKEIDATLGTPLITTQDVVALQGVE